jgi:hypothetical protein
MTDSERELTREIGRRLHAAL